MSDNVGLGFRSLVDASEERISVLVKMNGSVGSLEFRSIEIWTKRRVVKDSGGVGRIAIRTAKQSQLSSRHMTRSPESESEFVIELFPV